MHDLGKDRAETELATIADRTSAKRKLSKANTITEMRSLARSRGRTRRLLSVYFDTPRFEIPGGEEAVALIRKAALKSRINLGYRRDGTIHVCASSAGDAPFAVGEGPVSPGFDQSTGIPAERSISSPAE